VLFARHVYLMPIVVTCFLADFCCGSPCQDDRRFPVFEQMSSSLELRCPCNAEVWLKSNKVLNSLQSRANMPVAHELWSSSATPAQWHPKWLKPVDSGEQPGLSLYNYINTQSIYIYVYCIYLYITIACVYIYIHTITLTHWYTYLHRCRHMHILMHIYII
jgi:hypothetical protein